MSKVALQGNASGTGTLTVAAPNTNSDYTLTLPAETGTVLTSASDISTQTAAALNATGVSPLYACRAWINWNGNNSTINGSGGVSSYTRAGTGDYDINWTTAMPDTGYAIACCSGESRVDRGLTSNGLTTTKVTMNYEDTSGTRVDGNPLMIVVMR